ncbi:nucleolar protein 9 [Caloenas nicobarica]|uniref:nucleolar protein 9 n=1 Tax=Caloenas nicobarica TaxID=187106 RepID=UPI0032B7380F
MDLGAKTVDLGATVEGALWELGEWVLGDPVGFCKHPQGSFVVRGLLRALGGVPKTPAGLSPCPPEGAEPGTQGAEPATQGAELPPSFRLLLQRLAEAFETHLLELVEPASASLCLQEALRVLHRSQSEACARLCDALIGRLAPGRPGDPDSSLAAALEDPRRARLLEAAMTVGGAGRLRRLFRAGLRGRLLALAAHPLANHGLRRLLDHAPRDVVGEVLAELGPALARGHPGVTVALAGACRRHPPLQQEALHYLLQAFGSGEPPNQVLRVELLAKLRPPGGGAEEEGAETPVTLQGSLLLQHLLHFRGAEPVLLGGFRALPRPVMAAMALAPPGARLWHALMTSPSVPPPARRRLARKLQGRLSSLSCHRSGSRVVDAVWAAATGPGRAAMARELAAQLPALSSDPYGRFVARKLELDLFLRRPRLWERRHVAPETKSPR